MSALLQLGTTSDSGIMVGLRVVKGDDWRSGEENQDGEDFVGTVVTTSGRDDTVVVVWDNGQRAEYNAWQDLRVLDNAPAGSVSSQKSHSLLFHSLISSSSSSCLY